MLKSAMVRYLIVMLAFGSTAYGVTLPLTSCDSAAVQTGQLMSVGSDSFTDPDDIVVTPGMTACYEMNFKPNETCEDLKAQIIAVVLGFKVKWSGVNTKACNDLSESNKCPMIPGQDYRYKTCLTIPPVPKNIKTATYQWSLSCKNKDPANENVVCFQMTVKINHSP